MLARLKPRRALISSSDTRLVVQRRPERSRASMHASGARHRTSAPAEDHFERVRCQTTGVAEHSRRRPRPVGGPMSTSMQVDASVRCGHLNCPRCGLSIEVRPCRTAIRHCPRCVARSRVIVELWPRDAATRRLVFSIRNVGSAVKRRARAGSTSFVAGFRTACSVGPPTVSRTISPPDQFSVGGNYVLILTHYTNLFFTNRTGKLSQFGSLTTAVLRVPPAFAPFWRRGGCSCSVHFRL